MGNNDKFIIDLKTGEIGEIKTIEYLQKENFTQDIIDVRDDKFWRDNDVDFILICKNGDFTGEGAFSDSVAVPTGPEMIIFFALFVASGIAFIMIRRGYLD